MRSRPRFGAPLLVVLLGACSSDTVTPSPAAPTGSDASPTSASVSVPSAASSGPRAADGATSTGGIKAPVASGTAGAATAVTGGAGSPAAVTGSVAGASVASAGQNASAGPAAGAAAGSQAGSQSGGAGKSGGAGAGGATGVSSSVAPVLPMITGDCPTFKSGDFSFGKVSGVMDVGTKGSGGALLFYWAGTDFPASMYTQVGMGNVQKVTSTGGIIVSIQGSQSHAEDTDCSITGYYSHDYTPIGQIAACAVRDYGIDPRRIYSLGCSAGGVTSGCLATRQSAYIAAVATNSGGLTMVESLKDSKHAPAVMTMHGEGSDFGGLFTTESANLNKAITKAGGFAVNCNHGGAHCGASQQLMDAAFSFLFDHPYGVDPEPYASTLPSSFPNYCKIYK